MFDKDTARVAYFFGWVEAARRVANNDVFDGDVMIDADGKLFFWSGGTWKSIGKETSNAAESD